MLAVVVAFLTVVVALQLALTVALARRVKTLAEQHRAKPVPVDGPPVGRPVPAALLTDTCGTSVDVATLAKGDALLAFVAIGCRPCHEQLPALRGAMVSELASGGSGMVVALAPDGTADEVVDLFADLVPVVIQDDEAPVSVAFGVGGYPTYVDVTGGAVERVLADVSAVRSARAS